MENRYIFELRETITSFLKGESVKVILFCSQARRDNQIFSDVDIGIIPLSV